MNRRLGGPRAGFDVSRRHIIFYPDQDSILRSSCPLETNEYNFMKIQLYWGTMPQRLVCKYLYFGRYFCLRLQGSRKLFFDYSENEKASCSEMRALIFPST